MKSLLPTERGFWGGRNRLPKLVQKCLERERKRDRLGSGHGRRLPWSDSPSGPKEGALGLFYSIWVEGAAGGMRLKSC